MHKKNAKIDSLDRLISTANTDTGRIKLIVAKISVLSRINLDSSIKLCKQSLEEARKIHYYQGEIDIRQNLISNYCYKGEYKSAQEHLEYLGQFIKSKDSANLSDIYSNFGMLYGMQSKYDSSIYFYEKAIGIDERAGNKNSLPTNYSNISISYQQQSNFSRALFYLQKALKIAEEKKNEVSQAYIYQNMGNTYDSMEDSVRAEQSYLKAIEIAQKKSLSNVELYAYSNLSTRYIKEKKWQKAYDFGMKAAALGGAMGDQGIEAASMSKAATALAYSDRAEEAIALAKKAILIADSSAQPLNIIQANSSMGATLKVLRNYKEAITYFEKSLLSLQGTNSFSSDNADIYKDLAECYEKTGNYAAALKATKRSAEISDSARSKDNIRKATELTMNYEFEKKQQVQQAEQKAKEAVTRAKQLALLVGLGLTLALAVVSFIGFRNKQKANSLLKQQKEEIQTTLTKLKSTQSQLIQSEKMASLGELTAGIAHEIQNPLNFVNNFSEVSGELLEEMKTELAGGNREEAIGIANDVKRNLEKILHHGRRADDIVKGMLQHSRSSSGVKELTDINDLADEYLRLTYHGARAKDSAFSLILKTDLDKNIGKINVVPQDIGRVLLNLFTNSFYAVGEKKKQLGEGYQPTVSVTTKKLADHVEIKIADNGNGISQKILEKIFQPFFTTKPTGQGTGLGLSLSYDIITKEHGGTIKAETKEGEGVEFVIELPIA